jgi:small conductance mechanosensitive channel
VASLLRTVGTTLVVIVALMMAFREIGLDITPLIAGAGVAGLAIGFGAQSLIKDVVAGFFILLEDQFHVGDVIQAAGVSGQVEQMTLRMTIVRDLQGTVHFIPNGEIKVASNLTKEWSRAVLEIGVGYEEDVDRVIAVLTEVGRSLADDEGFGKMLLEAPQVLGVEGLNDSQVTIRILAKTLPLKQWEVARELRRRIKARFDREGIQTPYPHRVVITRPAATGGN